MLVEDCMLACIGRILAWFDLLELPNACSCRMRYVILVLRLYKVFCFIYFEIYKLHILVILVIYKPLLIFLGGKV